MITQEENTKIIATLGKHYSKKIIEYLKAKEIKPVKSDEFKGNFINQIVNGHYDNQEIEFQILELVKKTKLKRDRLEKKRESINKNL